jgi:hypothetical protein
MSLREAKIVWVAGMPRSGSMWTYNIARALVASAGHEVVPTQVPKLEAEVHAEAQRAIADPDPRRVWVLKTHHAIPFAAKRALVILPLRDPRDVVVSLMRFMRVPLGHAARGVDAWAALLDHYRQTLAPGQVLWLRYADLALRPGTVVDEIAGFLDVACAPDARDGLVAGLTKGAVRERLDRLTASGASADRVTNPDGSIRLFDPESGFQTGHVSDYCDGDWRRILPAGEAALIAERYADFLLRHELPAMQT